MVSEQLYLVALVVFKRIFIQRDFISGNLFVSKAMVCILLKLSELRVGGFLKEVCRDNCVVQEVPVPFGGGPHEDFEIIPSEMASLAIWENFSFDITLVRRRYVAWVYNFKK